MKHRAENEIFDSLPMICEDNRGRLEYPLGRGTLANIR